MGKKYDRRTFLQAFIQRIIGGGSVLFIGAVLLSGCQSDRSASDKKNQVLLDVDSCDDLSNVSEAELKKREAFGYVKESSMPDKQCDNCKLYIPPKENQKCGGCLLFAGPVFAGGYCAQYEPEV